MSDKRPGQVFGFAANGALAGAGIAALAVEANSGINVSFGIGNLVLYKGVTTGTALATGALAGGVIVGGLSVLYLYRNEIADVLNDCLKELQSLVQSLFAGVKEVLKWMTEMVNDVIGIFRTIVDGIISFVEKLLKKNISAANRKKLLRATDTCFKNITEAVDDFTAEVKPVAEEYDVDVEEIAQVLRAKTGLVKQKWRKSSKAIAA